MRWVAKVTKHDRTYYYFRRKPWPEARIHGEPGSPEFEACHQSLLAASTAPEVERIRDRTTKQHKRHDHFGADAIIAWAEQQPLTLEQAQHVRRGSVSLSMSCCDENKDFVPQWLASASRPRRSADSEAPSRGRSESTVGCRWVAPRHQAVAIVLDVMHPLGAGRGTLGK